MGEPVKKILIDDLRHLIQCQESWPVAAYWVKALRIDFEQNSLVSGNNTLPNPGAKALVDIRSKLLHFGQSVEEPEAWKGYSPTHGHDMFDVFAGKVSTQEVEVQETNIMEQFLTSDDVLLNELLGMGYTYSDSTGNYME
ncbi:hypothetical protein ONS96_011911 [Cadophora gregata f. sp. sojae]|nr:hypothetical protein ONS96_011911 [Cadophora gregata f. sp. sojae]